LDSHSIDFFCQSRRHRSLGTGPPILNSRKSAQEKGLASNPDVSMTGQTPPTFLVQADEDPVHVEKLDRLLPGLEECKGAGEKAPHANARPGYGLRRTELPVTGWPEPVEVWLQTIGMTMGQSGGERPLRATGALSIDTHLCASFRRYRVVAPAFFRAAQRAFIRAASFLRAAGLIGFRAGAFLAGGAAFFEADLPFRVAHRSFIAADIRLRAAGLMVRLRGPACNDSALGGRPPRGCDPSRAAIA